MVLQFLIVCCFAGGIGLFYFAWKDDPQMYATPSWPMQLALKFWGQKGTRIVYFVVGAGFILAASFFEWKLR